METITERSWISVCAIDDLVSHVGSCALLEGRQVAVFYFKDEEKLFAIDNYDPISGANVLSRGIVGDLNGEIVVASPLYKQHYSLISGQCLEREDVSVHVYDVREHNGQVELALPVGS